jgi:hypothetical protein
MIIQGQFLDGFCLSGEYARYFTIVVTRNRKKLAAKTLEEPISFHAPGLDAHGQFDVLWPDITYLPFSSFRKSL